MNRATSTWVVAAILAIATIAGADSGSRRTPVVRAVQRVAPATVNITSTQEVRQRANPFFRRDPFFEEFFGRFLDPRRTVQSLGTGLIISPQGHVLTNAHVLAGATQIHVALSDGREFDAELIGADPETDIALVQIHASEPLPHVELGSSDDLLIGETVIAIGNPFGLHHTVTTGVLSAENRSIRSGEREYHGFLQTDASINPGNSGGPLLNIDGDVIGINTAIFREAEGIGFAIPIDRAKRVVDDLLTHGEVIPVWLGLRLQDLTRSLRDAFSARGPGGVLITHVFDDSPAQRSKLRRGDILMKLDGTKIGSTRNYFEVLAGLTDGDRAPLEIDRVGDRHQLEARAEIFPESRADELGQILLGVDVVELTPQLARAQGIEARNGLVVRQVIPRSSADYARLRPGDVILRINREPVQDRVAFRKAITKLRGRRQVLLLVQRGRYGYSVPLDLS
ncbi:MAG: trypsin-like peptidase domain-containing protein [Myxococcota bacterium]